MKIQALERIPLFAEFWDKLAVLGHAPGERPRIAALITILPFHSRLK